MSLLELALFSLFTASSPDLAADVPGKFRPVDHGDVNTPRQVSKQQEKEMHTKMEAFIPELRSAIGEPVGCEIAIHNEVVDGLSLKDAPVSGSLYVQIFDLYRTKNGKVEPSGESSTRFFVAVNNLKAMMNERVADDDQGTMYREPAQTKTHHGFPVFGGTMLITKDKRLPWRPVSRERYAKAVLTKLKRKAEYQAKRNPTSKNFEAETVAKIEKELAALSPEERAEPMTLSPAANEERWYGFKPDYSPARVVEPDPTYYDRSRPTAIQSVTFFGGVGSVNTEKEIHDRYKKILNGVSLKVWAALLEL